jgi:hypothetical protein
MCDVCGLVCALRSNTILEDTQQFSTVLYRTVTITTVPDNGTVDKYDCTISHPLERTLERV